MINQELQEILKNYPTDMSMQVSVHSFISEIVNLNQCVDIDTNKSSLVIYGHNRDYFMRGENI